MLHVLLLFRCRLGYWRKCYAYEIGFPSLIVLDVRFFCLFISGLWPLLFFESFAVSYKSTTTGRHPYQGRKYLFYFKVLNGLVYDPRCCKRDWMEGHRTTLLFVLAALKISCPTNQKIDYIWDDYYGWHLHKGSNINFALPNLLPTYPWNQNVEEQECISLFFIA